MHLYIGNATKQVIQFSYRIPEVPGLRVQDIQIGGQIRIADELTSQQVDAIIEQHRKYGLVPSSDLPSLARAGEKAFHGLCYSVDRPIPVEHIQLALDNNQRVLEARGEKMRRDAAIATNNAIEQHLGETGTGTRLREVELSAVEEEPRGGYRDENPFGQGVRVTRDDAPTAARRRRSRGKERG